MSEETAPKAGASQAERDEAREEMRQFEQQDELPRDLSEWPTGKAKYVTFDTEDTEPYGEGLTEKLGPPVVHHEDGSVSVDGKKVDNPEDYKGKPIDMAVQVADPEPSAKQETGPTTEDETQA